MQPPSTRPLSSRRTDPPSSATQRWLAASLRAPEYVDDTLDDDDNDVDHSSLLDDTVENDDGDDDTSQLVDGSSRQSNYSSSSSRSTRTLRQQSCTTHRSSRRRFLIRRERFVATTYEMLSYLTEYVQHIPRQPPPAVAIGHHVSTML
jgi:hypothetical protein